MPYISEAKHRELEIQLYQFFLDLNTDDSNHEAEGLMKDRHLLQKMFNLYQEKLNELLKLIAEYQQVHRKTRVRLRKQQLSQKQFIVDGKIPNKRS